MSATTNTTIYTINGVHLPLWEAFQALDRKLKLRILLFAGREASAAVRIACGNILNQHNPNANEGKLAEEAILYEPFTYWDWQEEDANVRSVREQEGLSPSNPIVFQVEDEKRKRRLLWEREKGFMANGVWHTYPESQQRWDGFKRGFEGHFGRKDQNRKHVKCIAVASWMKTKDLKWIAQNLPRLTALDLSNAPEQAESTTTTNISNDFRWSEYLKVLKDMKPKCMIIEDLALFDCFNTNINAEGILEKLPEFSEEMASLEEFITNYEKGEFGYRQPIAASRRKTEDRIEHESFEEFFRRLLEKEENHRIRKGISPCDKLRILEQEISESHLLMRLKWLGLRDWRPKPSPHTSWSIIRKCASLDTVSIRGRYDRDFSSDEVSSVHHHICQFTLGIIRLVPDNVNTLELRLSLSFIKYFLEQLRSRKPTIQRVGIDLGAWIQVYPLRKPKQDLKNEAVRERAVACALSDYRRQCKNGNIKGSGLFQPDVDEGGTRNNDNRDGWIYKRKRPDFYYDNSGTTIYSGPVGFDSPAINDDPSASSGAASTSDYEKYDIFHDKIRDTDDCPLDDSGFHTHTIRELDRTLADTLPTMLMKLYFTFDTAHGDRNDTAINRRTDGSIVTSGRIELFGLEPEPQERSSDPIHPLSLAQSESKSELKRGSDYHDFHFSSLQNVYSRLAESFRWRPVFDWDWFMIPEKMASTGDPDLVGIGPSTNWLSSTDTNELTTVIPEIKKHFECLRDASIPVHLLIGRRDPNVSSCYWGWPYLETEWKQWLKDDFSVDLETLAPCVDILSISYDLRNPLDDDRLESIDGLQPYQHPQADCPTSECPWKKAGDDYEFEDCPFNRLSNLNLHPRQQVNKETADGERRQKMPNRRPLKSQHNSRTPKDSSRLAYGCTGPRPGENANDHELDESDNERRPAPSNLHQSAKRAAFTREALGWQRFWNKYALEFKNLTVLRVRMPHCFDKIGSWRLAKLLNQNAGWHMLTYTHERQHIHTEDDLAEPLPNDPKDSYRRKKEANVWPAGRFVRRTWVREELELDEQILPVVERTQKGIEGVSLPARSVAFGFKWRNDTVKHLLDESDLVRTAKGEEEEFQNALHRAETATANEAEIERSMRSPSTTLKSWNNASQLEEAFLGSYGQRVRNVAASQWRAELRELARQLELNAPDDDRLRKYFHTIADNLRLRTHDRAPYHALFLTGQDGWRDGIALRDEDEVVNEMEVIDESTEEGKPVEYEVQQEDFVAPTTSDGVIESTSPHDSLLDFQDSNADETQQTPKEAEGQLELTNDQLQGLLESIKSQSGTTSPGVLGPVGLEASSTVHVSSMGKLLGFDENEFGLSSDCQPTGPRSSSLEGLQSYGTPSRKLEIPAKSTVKGPFSSSSSDEDDEDDEEEDLYSAEMIRPANQVEPQQAATKAGFVFVEQDGGDIRVSAGKIDQEETSRTVPSEPQSEEADIGAEMGSEHPTEDAGVEVGIETEAETPIEREDAEEPSLPQGSKRKRVKVVEEEIAEAETPNPPKPAPKRGTKRKAEASASVVAPIPKRQTRATRSGRKTADVDYKTQLSLAELDEENFDNEDDGRRSKKRGTKRGGSSAAYVPPKVRGDNDSDDDESDPNTLGRKGGRATRASKKTATATKKSDGVAAVGTRKTIKATSRKKKAKETGEDDGNVVEPTNTNELRGPNNKEYYETLKVPELRKLVQARGHKLTELKRKAQLVAKLEEEDVERAQKGLEKGEGAP